MGTFVKVGVLVAADIFLEVAKYLLLCDDEMLTLCYLSPGIYLLPQWRKVMSYHISSWQNSVFVLFCLWVLQRRAACSGSGWCHLGSMDNVEYLIFTAPVDSQTTYPQMATSIQRGHVQNNTNSRAWSPQAAHILNDHLRYCHDSYTTTTTT